MVIHVRSSNKRIIKIIIDKEDPGTMTSYGHACTFADYASIPVNSPSLFNPAKP